MYLKQRGKLQDGSQGRYLQGVRQMQIGPPPAAPSAIPTLSEWALIGLSSVLAMLGIARARQRQR